METQTAATGSRNPQMELRKYCQRRKQAMIESRQPWMTDWRQVSEYMDPMRGQFDTGATSATSQENSRPSRRSRTKVINSKATECLRVMAAGMMSHMTSKARPWFKLTTPNPALAQMPDVGRWLDEVSQLIRDTLAKSNFYKAMPVMYTEDGMFGVAAMLAVEDPDDVVGFYPMTVGTYAIAINDRRKVDGLWRCYPKTARQLVERYGLNNVPSVVRETFNGPNPDRSFTVESLFERNPNERPGTGPMGLQAPQFRPYREITWIEGCAGDEHGILFEGGHYEFPPIAIRWNPVGEDVYSTSPGLDTLGDIKQLQYLEGEKLRLLDQITKPALNVPEQMRGKGGASYRSGAQNFLPPAQNLAKVEPTYLPPYQALAAVRVEIEAVEQRIEAAFYYTLFLMLQSLGDQTGRTATEIAERREEKATVLGPSLEAVTDEGLDPVVVRVYKLLERAGRLPEAPPALDSVPLKIEYTSILAQAARAVGASSIERTVMFAANLAKVAGPQVMDKVDTDQAVDEYAMAVGGPAALLNSDERVAAIRDGRAQQERMAQLAQMAKPMQDAAGAMKTMGEATQQEGSMAQQLAESMGAA